MKSHTLPRISRKANHQRVGGALLLTLVILAASISILVAFSRLVMVERRVSHGYSEILRADLAVEAGLADAQNLLQELFLNYPDAATYWEPRVGATQTPGTVYMYRDLAANVEYEGQSSSTAPKIFARPLISGAETREYYPTNEFVQSLPAASVSLENSIDLNRPGLFGRGSRGWVGSLPGQAASPIQIPWVQIKDADGVVRGRYAFWVEDESFKLNINTAQYAKRGLASAELDEHGVLRPAASLQGLLELDTARNLADVRESLPGTGGQLVSSLQLSHALELPTAEEQLDFARDYRFLLSTESSGLDLTRSGAKRVDLNQLVDRALGSLPQVPYGSVRTGPDLTGAAPKVQRAVDQIAAAIHSQAPHFGQRFYRLQSSNLLTNTSSSTVAGQKSRWDVVNTAANPHADIYTRKVATNIFDYLSPGANPTVLDNSGQVILGSPVSGLDELGFESGASVQTNPFSAIGKKNTLYFTEYLLDAKVLSTVDPSARAVSGAERDYEVEMNYYIELTNISDQLIRPADGDMGPDPYLIMEGQPWISMNNRSGKPREDVPGDRPFRIKLADDFVFNGQSTKLEVQPGEAIVICTDPNYLSREVAQKFGLTNQKVYVAPALYAPDSEQRVDQGWSEPPYPYGEQIGRVLVPNVRFYRFTSFDSRGGGDRGEVQFGPDMDGAAGTRVLLGNAYGLLEAHPSVAMSKTSNSNMIVFKGVGSAYRGSYVGGTRMGHYDPRGNLEALDILIQSNSTGEYTTTKLNGMDQINKSPPGMSNVGRVARISTSAIWDTDLIRYTTVEDATLLPGADNALQLQAQGSMRSVSELGRIFDPLRYGDTTLANIATRRSGGRSLTIGQPDALWDGTRTTSLAGNEFQYQTSPSRTWTAWRLCDIFTSGAVPTIPDTDELQLAGMYNPNGILRDEGRVLKALLEGIEFASGSASDPVLTGKTFSTADMGELVKENLRANLRATQVKTGGNALANFLAQRLTRSADRRFSPIWEAGELSQLAPFAPTSDKLIEAGSATRDLNDRGREEIFGRLVDLITPKGSTYSVYVVGQSLTPRGEPAAIQARRYVVRLQPKFEPALEDDFDPDSGAEERFRAPDAYIAQILSVEDAE